MRRFHKFLQVRADADTLDKLAFVSSALGLNSSETVRVLISQKHSSLMHPDNTTTSCPCHKTEG